MLTPLATQEGLKSVLRAWVPTGLSTPLVRYTPLEPLVTATAKAVAATWAAGRYADSVCRLRKAGADWLPAPLNGALNLAPSTLRRWSGSPDYAVEDFEAALKHQQVTVTHAGQLSIHRAFSLCIA